MRVWLRYSADCNACWVLSETLKIHNVKTWEDDSRSAVKSSSFCPELNQKSLFQNEIDLKRIIFLFLFIIIKFLCCEIQCLFFFVCFFLNV